MQNNSYFVICCITVALSLTGCKEYVSSVTGTLEFDGDVELSQVTRAEIKLIDISVADASSVLIAETIIKEITHVPVQFEIEYDDSVIILRNSYSVSADIYMTDASGKEMRSHITTQTYPVLTRGFGAEVNLRVQKIN
jgi:uncharacterized lipoprotein YbaY